MAGGLDLTTSWATGKATLYGIVQGTTNDYMFGYEIATTNMPPDTPAAPSGPSSGQKGVEYTFSAVTTDPEGDQVSYFFDWGDGTDSGWVGPFNSGVAGTAKHTYTGVGTLSILVKAKDSNGGESGWSDPHNIVISEGAAILKIQPLKGGLFKVKTSIKNTGSLAADNVQWTISLTGGAFIGKNSSGAITSIAAGGESSISSKFIIGFGPTLVKATAMVPTSSDTVEQNGTIFLFFIKL
jgi:hypothetical protein